MVNTKRQPNITDHHSKYWKAMSDQEKLGCSKAHTLFVRIKNLAHKEHSHNSAQVQSELRECYSELWAFALRANGHIYPGQKKQAAIGGDAAARRYWRSLGWKG